MYFLGELRPRMSRKVSSRAALVGVTCAIALAISLSSCASKVRVSSKSMCEAHGGTYSSQTKQCSYPAQPPPRNVEEICTAHGGTYDAVSESCVFEERTK